VSTQLTDQELVIACCRGEPLAWDTLVERYQRLVYAIPLRVGLTADDAADVFQTVFVSLLEHLDSLNRPQGLAKWLISTAQRESWRVCRSRGRESSDDRDLALLPDGTANPETEVGNAVDQELALAALEQVGMPCRELLHLLYFDSTEPSYEEIGRQLQVPVGSIGPTRARCLQKLRNILCKMGMG
jgi:RNA polymerase sigma factor (sigma-70 family)